MKMRIMLIWAAFVLAACSAGASGGDDETGPVASGIEGEYVVAYVNEERPLIGIEGSEPTVMLDGARLHFQSQCIYQDWAYRLSGEQLAISGWDYGDELVAMCARALAPGEEAIIAALGEADTLRRVNFGLHLSGEGGTVQLRRVPSDKELAGRAVDLTGHWSVTELNGVALPHALRLTADFDRMWWEPGCAAQGRAYAIADSAFATLAPGQTSREVCDIGVPPELERVWQALDAADAIARTADGKVLLSGNGRQVLLTPIAGELP